MQNWRSIFSSPTLWVGVVLVLGTVVWITLNTRRSMKGGSNTRAAGVLKRFAATHGYKVLHNITLQGKNGPVHTDHILVGYFGVLFINVLGQPGSYYGEQKDENWAFIPVGETKKYIPNPLRRGEAAMEAMRGILVKNSVYNIALEQLVVFLPTFNDKRELGLSKNLPVTNVRRLGARLSTQHFESDNGVDVPKLAALIMGAAQK